MIEKGDWRLQGQEEYLTGVVLQWKKYTARSEPWEHEHCAFCWSKIMDSDEPEIQKWGYATTDEHHWLCEQCYEDFREMFQWTLVDALPKS